MRMSIFLKNIPEGLFFKKKKNRQCSHLPLSVNPIYFSRVRYGFQYFSSIGCVNRETSHINTIPTRIPIPIGGMEDQMDSAAKAPVVVKYCQIKKTMPPPMTDVQAALILARLEYKPKMSGMKYVNPKIPKQ